MIELYGLSSEIRIFYSALLALAIIIQTVLLLLLISHKEHRVPLSVLLHEVLILIHFICAVMLISITLFQRNIVAQYLYILRFPDLALIAQGIFIAIKFKKKEPVIISVILIPILPFWSYEYMKYFFLLSNFYLMIRCLTRLDQEWQRIRKSISRLSIKDAVDVFPGGILFSNEKGRILIINPVMHRLLVELGLEPEYRANSIWDSLMRTQESYDVSIKALEDKLLIRIRNAGSWLFSRQIIFLYRKKYIQLLAVDITDEDMLTRELEESNKALKESGEELAQAVRNIEQLEKEREILRMKARIHDILGQRLSILSRLLESEMDAGDIIKNFKPLLSDLTQAVTENTDALPLHLLSSLAHSFALIGTNIHLEGELPDNKMAADVFAGSVRECATNAVRHANAANVYVKFIEDESSHQLFVCNDGDPPADTIKEGGGITGMRRQTEELKGSIDIVLNPRFCVKMHVPKNRKEKI